jgi:putative ABC transport system ATP-binding protein
MELLKLSNKRFRQTVLLITHDERLALEADRILVMEDGRIVSDEAVAK